MFFLSFYTNEVKHYFCFSPWKQFPSSYFIWIRAEHWSLARTLSRALLVPLTPLNLRRPPPTRHPTIQPFSHRQNQKSTTLALFYFPSKQKLKPEKKAKRVADRKSQRMTQISGKEGRWWWQNKKRTAEEMGKMRQGKWWKYWERIWEEQKPKKKKNSPDFGARHSVNKEITFSKQKRKTETRWLTEHQ